MFQNFVDEFAIILFDAASLEIANISARVYKS
jgi:hypothetical protein